MPAVPALRRQIGHHKFSPRLNDATTSHSAPPPHPRGCSGQGLESTFLTACSLATRTLREAGRPIRCARQSSVQRRDKTQQSREKNAPRMHRSQSVSVLTSLSGRSVRKRPCGLSRSFASRSLRVLQPQRPYALNPDDSAGAPRPSLADQVPYSRVRAFRSVHFGFFCGESRCARTLPDEPAPSETFQPFAVGPRDSSGRVAERSQRVPRHGLPHLEPLLRGAQTAATRLIVADSAYPA